MTPLIMLEKQSDYDKIETIFNEIRLKSKPKLMTFGDVLDLPEKHWKSIVNNMYQYGRGMCNYADLEPWKVDTNEKNMKRLESSGDNAFFHASKCRYLVDTWKEEGWYSCPQGVVRVTEDIFFHPGSIRQYAMVLGDMREQEIFLWDCGETELFPEHEIIDYETWKDKFKVDRPQWIDIRGMPEHGSLKGGFTEEPLLEWHVDEDRPNYYNTAQRIQSEIFNFKKPRLFGVAETNKIEEAFSMDNTECLNIHMKNNEIFLLEDFKHIFNIPYEEKIWECDKFKVIKTF